MRLITKVALALFAFAGMAIASPAPNPAMHLLTWAAAPGVTSYVVYSAPTPDGPFTKIGTTNFPAFVIADSNNTFYRIKPAFGHSKPLVLTPTVLALPVSDAIGTLPLFKP